MPIGPITIFILLNDFVCIACIYTYPDPEKGTTIYHEEDKSCVIMPAFTFTLVRIQDVAAYDLISSHDEMK